MAFLGDLLIRLRADTADFQSDMGKAAYVTEKSMQQIQRSAAKLGVLLGAGAFVAMVKGSIDAADHLNDLSKTTGIAVDHLAGLRLASKQSGGDLDSIAASVNKLSVNIGKDAEKFAALGVSAKNPLEAFKQLADVFVAIRDPQLRAAVAAEALGKSWAGAAPLLAEGGRKIGEMVDRGAKLSGMTEEIAQQADAFNDKMQELVGTGGLFTGMVGPMLPLLNSLAEDLLKVSSKTDALNSSFKPLAETLKPIIVLGANISFVFETMGKDIARAAENVKLIAKGDFAGSRALGEIFRKDAEAARAALDAYERKILGLGLTGQPAAGAGGADPGAAAAAASRARAFLTGNKAAEDAAREAERYRKLDNAGWVAHIEAVAGEYENGLRDMAKITADFYDNEDRLQKLDSAGWIAKIEADTQAYEDELRQLAKIAENTTDQMTEFWKEAAKSMQASMSDFFFDVMQGNLKDLAGSFARTIDRMVANVLAAKAATALFGDEFGKGGAIGGIVGKVFGSFGAQAPAPVVDMSFATGTNYVPHTGLALVHQGEQVIPAGEAGAPAMNVTNVFNVSGAMDTRTQAQIAAAAGLGVQRALARNT